ARLLKNAQEDAARLLKNAQEDAARLLKNAQEDAARLLKNEQENEFGNIPKIEKQALSNEERAIRKNKLYAIGELSSRLAHDLQNPLAVIKNTLEILRLRDPKLDEKTRESYDRMERATTRMMQQIREVLDFVRTGDLMREEILVSELLKTVIEDMDVPKEIQIILPSQDAKIFVDIKQMQTVFANLILNAIQAIDDKGKIMIQVFDSDDDVVIEVIDNGHGIKKENVQHVFEPLFTTKQSGTGLGLASCKAVIENHSGTIDCTSIVNKGTVFTVRLPKV
ncbi:MAG: HAMP domain-containing histidine kinase, partial [Candidatus Nitrosotenuis sp.]